MLKALADRTEDPLLRWGADYAEHEFVDLLEIIKTHYFGVSGLGLKSIAQYAGFRWRDADPGGLNSQTLVRRRRARQRRVTASRPVAACWSTTRTTSSATGWLRAWLRAQ